MLTAKSLWWLMPEIVLVLTAVVLYLRGAFARQSPEATGAGKTPATDPVGPMADGRSVQIALVGVVVAGWALARFRPPIEHSGPVLLDGLGQYVRWLSLAGVGFLVLLGSSGTAPRRLPEYLGTLLLAGAGVMLVAVADNLVLLFLGLELVSIPTYILLCVGRQDASGAEAAAKYFFLSLVASALVLYGMSFLYGAGGSLELKEIRARLAVSAWTEAGWVDFANLAVVLLLAGLGFKIAAVPFHFYAPDVYQGTSYPNAALLSVAPKVAGFTALVRILVEALPTGVEYGLAWRVLLALALLTMTVGNVVGLWQEHVRRLLAYSSIGQTGYILAGLAVGLAGADSAGRADGLAAVLLYLAVYAVATVGAFSVLESLRRTGQPVETLEDLGGLARRRPWSAAWLSIFMFSLAGVPPLAGFWGKWAVVLGAIKTALSASASPAQTVWFMLLAVLTMVNAAVAAGYYLRLVAAVYFWPSVRAAGPAALTSPAVGAVLCGLLCVAIGLVPWPLWNAAGHAVEAFAYQPAAGSVASIGDWGPETSPLWFGGSVSGRSIPAGGSETAVFWLGGSAGGPPNRLGKL